MASLTVRVTPRGGRDQIDGWGEDDAGGRFLKLRVSAAATDGAANAAVILLIAKTLGLPKSAVRLASGAAARIKRLEIDGCDAARLADVFGA